MTKTKIEWSETTWNPTTGCTEISAGCANCYAKIMSKRLQAMGQEKYKDNFEVRTHLKELRHPYTWQKPKLVFVNSMSDLFHDEVPLEFIKSVFQVMNDNPQHTFQVLTKRAERLLAVNNELIWTPNIWMGVSVENRKVINRIELLSKTNAQTKFVSFEPLLGPLGNINLTNIDWAIVGGESGFKPRPIKKQWVIDIKRQCRTDKTAFFFKQWGGKNKKKNGRLLNGRTYNEMPNNYKMSA